MGKTALRIAQIGSLATGRSLTGEHVFCRCRALILSFEDDRDELRRRVYAAMLKHGIKPDELRGWLFLAAPKGLKLPRWLMARPRSAPWRRCCATPSPHSSLTSCVSTRSSKRTP